MYVVSVDSKLNLTSYAEPHFVKYNIMGPMRYFNENMKSKRKIFLSASFLIV